MSMETVLAILSIAACLILAFGSLGANRQLRAARSDAASWARRRRQILSPSQVAAGLPAALIMEVGLPANVLTLEATADGAARIYSSAGGEPIEAGGRAAVLEAALALMSEADAQRGSMKRVQLCPRPGQGNVRFNLVSDGEIRSIEEDEEALDRGWSPLSRLYAAGVATIQALRAGEEGAAP